MNASRVFAQERFAIVPTEKISAGKTAARMIDERVDVMHAHVHRRERRASKKKQTGHRAILTPASQRLAQTLKI
jgi:hypothetical protein